MSRFSYSGYWALNNLAYANPSIVDAKHKVNQVLGLDLDDDQFDLTIRSTSNGMLGAAAVKDLNGNNHFATTQMSDNQGTHAELALFKSVFEHYSTNTGRLNAAKVCFYLHNSPCRDCTSKIIAWCQKCAGGITGSAAKANSSVYFVFNFHAHYLTGKTDQTQNFWNSFKEADNEYAKVTKNSGVTGFLPSRKNPGKSYRYPRISFRRLSSAPLQKLAKTANPNNP